jgi:secreted trypsin-like serine protease
MKFASALLLITVQLAWGAPNYLPRPRHGGRIVGGIQIKIEDAPYQAALTANYLQFCGGSIISDTWILTAAHCVDGMDVSALQVRVGSEKHATAGYLLGVQKIVIHPLYNPYTIDYDFALVELAVDIPTEGPQQTILLPEQDEPVVDGTLALVSGWGETKVSFKYNSLSKVKY